MSIRARVAVIGVAAAVFAIVLAAWSTVGSAEAREIVIKASDMAFFLDGQSDANPTIRVGAGERVRLTFVNDDDGMDHDVAIQAWKFALPVVHGKGRASAVLQAPDQPGRTEYVCTLHSSMMKGTIDVAARTATPTQH